MSCSITVTRGHLWLFDLEHEKVAFEGQLVAQTFDFFFEDVMTTVVFEKVARDDRLFSSLFKVGLSLS